MIKFYLIRTAILFALILLFNFGVAQVRQIHLNNISQDNEIRNVSFYTAKDGYISVTGAGGDCVGYTIDTGRTYIKKYITNGNVNYNGFPVNLTFGFTIQGVKAFNQNRLLAYGHYGFIPSILLSNDGGSSYTLIYHSRLDPFSFPGPIADMIFPDNGTVGYAVDRDRILKTTNQGSSWQVIRTEANAGYSELEAVDNNNIFAFSVGYNTSKIIKTTNAGGTFSNVMTPSFADGSLLYLHFFNAQTGWYSFLKNNLSYLYKTTNAGATWTLINDPDVNPFFASKIKFTDLNTGYALANDLNTVYKTTNGGMVWEPLQRDNSFAYLNYSHTTMDFFSPSQFWVGGNKEFLELSTNGGGVPLPKAYFKIDTTGYNATGNVQLINSSNTSHSFKWYVNNVLQATTYNASYTHNPSSSQDSVKLVATAANGKKDSLTLYSYFYVAPPPPTYTGWENKTTNINDNLVDVRFFGTRGIVIGDQGIYYNTLGANNASAWTKYSILNNNVNDQQLSRTKFIQLVGDDKSPIFYAIGNDTIQNKGIIFKLDLQDSSYSFVYIGAGNTKLNAAIVTDTYSNTAKIQAVGNNGLFVTYQTTNNILTVHSFDAPNNLTAIHARGDENNVVVVVNKNKMCIGVVNTAFFQTYSKQLGRDVSASSASFGFTNDYFVSQNRILKVQSSNSTLSLDSVWRFKPQSSLMINSLAPAKYGINIYAATNLGIYKVATSPSGSFSTIMEYQPTSQNKVINRIWFKQRSQYDTGYAVGPNGLLLSTINFGGPTKPYAEIYNTNPGVCVNQFYGFGGLSGTGTTCEWYINNVLTANTCSNGLKYMTVVGTYNLKYVVSNQFGLADTATKTFYVTAPPATNLPFALSDTILCKIESVQVTIQNTEQNTKYELIEIATGNSFGSIISNGGAVNFPSSQISKTGFYTIRSSNAASGCSRDFTSKIFVKVEKTKAFFTGEKINVAVGERLNLKNNSVESNSYQWTFNQDANIASSTVTNPQSIFYSSIGPKTATLVSTSLNGCKDTTTLNTVFVYLKPTNSSYCFAQAINDSDFFYTPASYPAISAPVVNTGNNSYFISGYGNKPIVPSRFGVSKRVRASTVGYFAKYTEDGVLSWMHHTDTLGNITGNVVDDEKNIYIIGSSSIYSYYHFNNGDSMRLAITNTDTLTYGDKTNGFILKVDSSGNYLWHIVLNAPANSYSTGCQQVGGLPTKIIVNGNHIAITGDLKNTTDFYRNGLATPLFFFTDPGCDNRIQKTFIIKIQKNGGLVWKAHSVRGFVNLFSRKCDIAFDDFGNLYMAQAFELKVDLYDNDSTHAVDYSGPVARSRSYTAKFNLAGDVVWKTKIEQQNTSRIVFDKIAVDGAGNNYITGVNNNFGFNNPYAITNSDGTISVTDSLSGFSVLKFNSSGVYKWAIGSTRAYYGMSSGLAISGNNIYAAGKISGNNVGTNILTLTSTDGNSNTSAYYGSEFFIAHYDTTGKLLRIGKSGESYVNITTDGIVLDNSGNFLLSGVVEYTSGGTGTYSIFNNPMQVNRIDVYLAKLNPNFCYSVLPITVFAGNDTTVCKNASVQLGSPSQAGHSYSWTSSPAGFTSAAARPTVSPTVTTTYYLSVLSPGGVYGFDTVRVSIFTPPLASAGIDKAICLGGSTQIGSPVITGNTYSWISSPVGFTSTLAMPTVSPTTTTTYFLSVTDANGCPPSRDTVLVIVGNALTPSVAIATNSSSNCTGVPLTFTATAANGGSSPSYQWQVNSINAGTNNAVFTSSSLINNDQIKVLMTSNAGCVTTTTVSSNSITVLISGSVVPTVSIVSSQPNGFCDGTAVSFTATPINAGASPTYQWKINGNNAGTNNPIFTTTTLANGDNVIVSVTSSIACAVPSSAISNVIIASVNPSVIPSVLIMASNTNICTGTAVTFTASTINGGSNPGFQWKVNGNNAITNAASFTTSTLQNNDRITLVITSNAGCASPIIATSNVLQMFVSPPATPSVSIASSSTTVCGNSQVTFNASVSNVGSSPQYQWLVNGTNVGSNNPTYSSNNFNSGDIIRVRVTSNAACQTTNLSVSNAITLTTAANVIPIATLLSSSSNVCISNPFGISFNAINAAYGSSVQLWESVNNAPYVLSSTRPYLSTAILFPLQITTPGTSSIKFYGKIIPPINTACVQESISNIVIVNVVNSQAPIIISNNMSQLFITNPVSGYNYVWQSLTPQNTWSNLSPIATGNLYQITENGSFRVAAGNGPCILYSNIIEVTSFRSNGGRTIVLYPNPARTSVTLDSLLLLDRWNSLTILNAGGAVVFTRNSLARLTKITVGLNNLPSGTYTIILYNEAGKRIIRRFIKI